MEFELIPGTCKMLEERFGRFGRWMGNFILVAIFVIILSVTVIFFRNAFGPMLPELTYFLWTLDMEEVLRILTWVTVLPLFLAVAYVLTRWMGARHFRRGDQAYEMARELSIELRQTQVQNEYMLKETKKHLDEAKSILERLRK